MKHRALLLLSTAFAAPAIADTPASGQGSFADGRGHIAFETGWVDIGFDPVNPDGALIIDGVAFDTGAGSDRISGTSFGGSLTFDLPGGDTPSWLGRNLRLRGGFERQRASNETFRTGDGPTIDESFAVSSVGDDGRAVAYSFSSASSAVAFATIFGADSSASDSCSDGNGIVQADASLIDTEGGLSCTITATTALATVKTADPNVLSGASAYAQLLPGLPIDTIYLAQLSRRIDVRRGTAAMEGDYDVGPGLRLSPSVGLTLGTTTSSFTNGQFLSDDALIFGVRTLTGRTVSNDAGISFGARLAHDAGSGFDVYVSATATLLRRKVDLEAESFAASSINGAYTFAGNPGILLANALITRTEAVGAVLGQLEGGAAYTFEPGAGIGAVRIAVTGGVTYDSDVATYGNVGLRIDDPLAGPVAPAHIAYTGETTFTLKGAITFELP